MRDFDRRSRELAEIIKILDSCYVAQSITYEELTLVKDYLQKQHDELEEDDHYFLELGERMD